MIQVFEKRAQIQLSIRRQSRDRLFSEMRQTALNSLFFQEVLNIYMAALATGDSAEYVLLHMLEQLLPLPYQGQHFVVASTLLSMQEDLVIRRGNIATFVRLAGTILQGPSKQAASEIASIQYIKWLYCYLLDGSEKPKQLKDQASEVCYQLSLLYMQAKHYKPERFSDRTIEQVITANSSSTLTNYSKRLLAVTLFFAGSSQLTYQHKSKLIFLARFLYSKIQNCFLQAPTLDDHLLLSIGSLLQFKQCDFHILQYLLKRFATGFHRKMLEMMYRQSEQSSLLFYSLVREVLHEVRDQACNVQDQKMFLLILRNLIINQSASYQCVASIYQDFLAGKLQLLIQPNLLLPLISLLTAIASSPPKALDQSQFTVSCVKCIEFCLSERHPRKAKLQLSSLKLRLILQLAVERYITTTKAVLLSEYLPPQQQKYFLGTIQLMENDEL